MKGRRSPRRTKIMFLPRANSFRTTKEQALKDLSGMEPEISDYHDHIEVFKEKATKKVESGRTQIKILGITKF